MSDKLNLRIENISNISGESKNSVVAVLLGLALGGNSDGTCDGTSTNENGKNVANSQEAPMVSDSTTDNSKKESDGTSDPKTKRVSSPPTPPSPSQKKKEPKGSQKEKVSSLGNGRKPKDFAECLEYFGQRGIPNPKPKAEQFYDHYEANGWKQGRTPLIKWGAALTKWIGNNEDWKPKIISEGNGISLTSVLEWMEKKHPEWHEKHKNIKNINEIDGFYIDEYRA